METYAQWRARHDLETDGFGSANQEPTPHGASALKDRFFLSTLRQFYRDKGQEFADDQQLIDHARRDNIWKNWNSAATAYDTFKAMRASPEERERMRRVKEVFDDAPFDYSDIPTYIGAVVADPLNLVGGAGGFAKGAKALMAGEKFLPAAAAAAKAGFKSEALASGITSGAADLLQQKRDQELGLRDDTSLLETGAATVSGGLIGGGAGAVFGVAGLAAATPAVRRIARGLRELGYPEERMAAMSYEEGRNLVREQTRYVAPTPDPGLETPAAAAAPAAEPEKPLAAPGFDPKEFEADAAQLNQIAKEWQEHLAQARLDGDDSPGIQLLARGLNALTKFQDLPARLQKANEDLKPLLQGNTINRAERDRAIADVNNLMVEYRAVLKDPRPERFIELAQKQEEALAAAKEAEASAKAAKRQRAPQTNPDPAVASAEQTTTESVVAPQTKTTANDANVTASDASQAGPVDADAIVSGLGDVSEDAKAVARALVKAGKVGRQVVQNDTGLPLKRIDAAFNELKGSLIVPVEGKKGTYSFAPGSPMAAQVEANRLAKRARRQEKAATKQTEAEIASGVMDFDASDVQLGDKLWDSLTNFAKEQGVDLNEPEVIKAAEVFVRSQTNDDQADGVWNYVRMRYVGQVDPDDAIIASKAKERGLQTDQFLRSLARTLQAKHGLSYEDAVILAKARVAATEGNYDPKAPNARPKMAGRNPDGSVQSMLKPGKYTGEGRTVTDGPVDRVQKNLRGEATDAISDPKLKARIERVRNNVVPDRRAAVSLAQRQRYYTPEGELIADKPNFKGRMTLGPPSSMPIAYYARKGEPLMDTNGVRARHNQVVFYDPINHVSFSRLENARPGLFSKAADQYNELKDAIRALKKGETPQVSGQASTPTNKGSAGATEEHTPKLRGGDRNRAPDEVILERAKKNDEKRKAEADAAKIESFKQALLAASGAKSDNYEDALRSAFAKLGTTKTTETREKTLDASPSVAAKADLPDFPATDASGARLAIRRLSNPEDVRVLHPDQEAAGKGIADMLGKTSMDEWEVGYVSKGSSGTRAAIDSFVPAEAAEATEGKTIGEVAVDDLFGPAKAPPIIDGEEAMAPVAISDEARSEVIDILKRLRRDEGTPYATSSGTVSMNAMVNRTIDMFNRSEVPDGLARIAHSIDALANAKLVTPDIDVWGASIADLYDWKARHFPGKPRYSLSDVKEARASFANILSGVGPDQVAFLTDLLERLGSHGVGLPKIQEGAENRSFLGKGGLTVELAKKASTPRSILAAHELGHWAYMQILSDAQKAELWRTMSQKYAGPDGQTMLAIQLPGIMENETDTLDEFFANQFSMYVAQKLAPTSMREASLWAKIADMVKNVIRFFFEPENIDPDLKPYFDHIINPRKPDDIPFEVPDPISGGNGYRFTQYKAASVYNLTVRVNDAANNLKIALKENETDLVAKYATDLRDTMVAIEQYEATRLGSDGKPADARNGIFKNTKKLVIDTKKRLDDAIDQYVPGMNEYQPRDPEDVAAAVRDIMLTSDTGKKLDLEDAVNLIINNGKNYVNAIREERVRVDFDENHDLVLKPKTAGQQRQQLIRERSQAKLKRQKDVAEALSKAIKSSARERKPAEVEDPVNIRTVHPDVLANEINKWKDTDYGAQLEAEMRRRLRAKPLDKNAVRTRVNAADVMDAMAREIDEYKGVTSEDGIAPSAPAEVRDVQARLTHRDPVAQEVMRSLHYRLHAIGAIKGDLSDPAKFEDHRASLRRTAIRLVKKLHSLRTGEPVETDAGVKLTVSLAMEGEKPMSFKQIASFIDPYSDELPPILVKEALADHMKTGSLNRLADLEPTIFRWVKDMEDRVGYLLSGNIALRELKARHAILDNYGDVFEDERNLQMVNMGDPNRHFDMAGPTRQASIKSFVQGGVGWDGEKPVVFWHVNDASAPDVVAREPGIYPPIRLSPTKASTDWQVNKPASVRARETVEASGADTEELSDLMYRYADLDSDIEVGRYRVEKNPTPENIKALEDKVAEYEEIEREFQRIAEGGAKKQAVPVYVSMKRPFFLSNGGEASREAFDMLIGDIIANGMTVSVNAQKMIETDWRGEKFDMETLRKVFQTRGLPITQDQLIKRMELLGYDGIIKESWNPKDTMAFPFAAWQIKRVDADKFGDGELLSGDMESRPYFGTDDISDEDISSHARERAVGLISQMEKAGLPQPVSETLMKVARGRHLNERDGKTIYNASRVDRFFAPNAERLRKAGMNSFADWLAPANGTGHFERVASETANIIEPLTKKMAALPDTAKHLKAWAESTKGLIPFMKTAQPESHKRIVSALRRPLGSEAERSLSAEEAGVYRSVRREFKSMIDRLRDAGVMTSEIVGNYFPQVWNKDAIALNEEAFRKGLVNYFMREDLKEGRARTRAQVHELANNIVENLLNDDGVFIPPPGSGSSDLIGDSIDYQRMLRLESDPKGLKELEPFLEDNLGAIVTKYMDHAVRRLEITKKWGTAGHGYHDYMNIMTASVNGDPDYEAAKLLINNKVFRKNIYATSDDGERVLLEFRNEVPMPFQHDPEGAFEAIDNMKALIPQGPKAMSSYLLSLAPEPTAKSNAFQRRADAIANAIYELNTSEVALHSDSINHADAVMRSVLHKPVDSSSPAGSLAGRTTRALRNFNAVTLLSFTLLSSFGDVTMPLIRSGSMKAALAGWRKAMFDKEYRQMMQNVGVNIESLVHEHMVSLYGSDSTKFTTAFFNATGLTPWTRFMREASGSIGYEWFKAEFRRASSFGPDSPEYKKAYRHLRRYGLDGLLREGVSIDAPDAMSTLPELRQAIIKFANDTIFEPNKNDIPVMWQTPVGQLLFQLKSFPLMMMRLGKHVFNEAGFGKEGVAKGERDFGPLLAMLGVAPVVGSGAMALKDIVQARGEDNTHQVRERLGTEQPLVGELLQAAGIDKDDKGAVNAFLGWYIESLFFLGGFGLIGDMLHDTAANLDNGAYGVQRVAGTVFGPAVGDFVSGFNVLAGGMQAYHNAATGEEKNAAMRSGVREVVGRVPIVGGIKSVREGVVDAVAGPSSQDVE